MSDDPLDLDTGLPERIAADAAVLTPLTLSVARRLPASAGADSVMRPDLAELARELRSGVAAVEAALEQLQRRGHLIVEPGSDPRAVTERKRDPSAVVLGDTRQLDLFARVIPALTCRPHGLVGYRFADAPPPPAALRVVPFPRSRNRERMRHHAANMARMSKPSARLYLRRMMRVYAEELRGRGVAEQMIEREVDVLSRAIRAVEPIAILTPDEEPA